jgi:hypothetical protein
MGVRTPSRAQVRAMCASTGWALPSQAARESETCGADLLFAEFSFSRRSGDLLVSHRSDGADFLLQRGGPNAPAAPAVSER